MPHSCKWPSSCTHSEFLHFVTQRWKPRTDLNWDTSATCGPTHNYTNEHQFRNTFMIPSFTFSYEFPALTVGGPPRFLCAFSPRLHYRAFIAKIVEFTGWLLSSRGKCVFSWWVVKLAWCSIDEQSSRISRGLIIWRVWIMLFSLLYLGTRARRCDREGARRDVAWQLEVSDRIFGATAARLSANWVLRKLSRELIGPPPAGSSPSLADRTPLSLGHSSI